MAKEATADVSKLSQTEKVTSFEANETAGYKCEPTDSMTAREAAKTRLQYVRLMPKAAALCLISSLFYLSYRVLLLLTTASVEFSAYVFVGIEIAVACVLGLVHLQDLAAWGKGKLQLPQRLTGNNVPMVDVFITCCGEPIEIVLDTVRASCCLDYPKHRFRITVLDDAASVAVKERVLGLRQLFPENRIHYSSRQTQSTSHSKAGNLNHGLEYVTQLEGGVAEFVAVLDVDMIPFPHWLRSTLPYLLLDQTVGLANPAQRFYNLPNGDPLVQNLDLMYDGIEALKSCTGSAWCTGTGYVVRRTAIEGIGNYPTHDHNDDILTSIYLQAQGWKTVYVPETIQRGLVPDTVQRTIKQYQRWNGAHMFTVFSFWNSRAKGRATLGQRLGITLSSASLVFAGVTAAVSLIVVPFQLYHGSQVVAYETEAQLRTMLLLETASFAAQVYSGYLRSATTNFTGHILADWQQVAVVPFLIMTDVRIFVHQMIRGTPLKFAPSMVNDSDRKQPAPRVVSVIPETAMVFCLLVCFSYTWTAYRAIQALFDPSALRLELFSRAWISHLCFDLAQVRLPILGRIKLRDSFPIRLANPRKFT
ncbi:MAG: hypothetical protein Q9226_001983 [Calogaya cf. arnoldii]